MRLKSAIKRLERIKALENKEYKIEYFSPEERKQAIDLLINEIRPWPAELQRKRELTCFSPDYFSPDIRSIEQRHKRINELLVKSSRRPIVFEEDRPQNGPEQAF